MIVSESRKFVFIHIQKTGGTSLKRLLKREVPDARWILGTHDPARRGLEALGYRWEDHFRFAFVRNPFDRLVSWYTMFTELNPSNVRNNRGNRFWHYIRSEARSFEDFVVRCTDVIDDFDGRKSIAFDQLDYVTDPSGLPIVDYVGRFERFEEDAAEIFERIGVDGSSLEHKLRSRGRRHYSEYYTPALRDLVAERHQRDLEYFGYSFEDGSGSIASASASSSAGASPD